MPEPPRSPEPGPARSPALTEPHESDPLYPEAPAEVYVDAVESRELVDAELEMPVRRRLGAGFWVAITVFLLITLLAFTADWLPLQDPDETNTGLQFAGPSADHWFGNDELGRDLFSRVIHGGRVSIIIGFSAALFGLVLGGLGGLLAGYYRGKPEAVILWATDVMLSFPAIVLAIALATFWGNSVWNIALILGIIAIWPIIRIARANTLVYSQREFVLAAQAIGAPRRRILRRDVLPNVLPAMAAFSLIVVAIVIVAEASLSLIGVADPEAITWGRMIADGARNLDDAPHVVFVPCAALFLTVLSLNLAGDQVRAYFDVKEAGL